MRLGAAIKLSGVAVGRWSPTMSTGVRGADRTSGFKGESPWRTGKAIAADWREVLAPSLR